MSELDDLYGSLESSLAERDDEPSMGSDLDSLYGAFEEREKKRTRSVRQMAALATIDQSPDQAAEINRLAERTGVTPDVVRGNLERARQQAELNGIDFANLPEQVGRLLEKPDVAPVIRDDLDALTGVERAVAVMKFGFDRGRQIDEEGRIRAKWLDNGLAALSDEELDRLEMLESKGGEFSAKDDFARDWLQGVGEFAGSIASSLPYAISVGASAGMAAGTTAAVLGQLGPQILAPEEILTVPVATGTAFVAGTAAAMFAHSSKVNGGLLYKELQDIAKGLDEPIPEDELRMVASIGGVLAGSLDTVGAATLAAPFIRAGKRAAGRDVMEKVLRQNTARTAIQNAAKAYGAGVAGETFTETFQEVINIAAGEYVKANYTDNYEFDAEAAKARIAETLTTTFKAMVFLAGPGAGLQFTGDAMRARRARQNREQLLALGKAVEGSKLRDRMPGAMSEFVANSAGTDGVENVFIEAQAFRTLFQDNMDKVADELGITDQIQQAMGSNADLVIPLGVVAEKMSGTPEYEKFVDQMRLNAGDMSMAEARTWAANSDIQRDLELAEAELTDTQMSEIDASADRVESIVLEQLEAAGQAPQNAKRQAALHRAFFRTMGIITGQDPATMFAGENLSILGPGNAITLADGRTLTQDDPRMVRAREQRFDTRRVLYHGTTAQDIQSFRKSEVGTFGVGVYLSSKPDTANFWADPELAEGETDTAIEGSNLIPVFIRGKFMTDQQWMEEREAHPEESDEEASVRLAGEGWDGVDQGDVDDGVIVVFEPGNIRSINAEFGGGPFNDSENLLDQAAFHGTPHLFDRFMTQFIDSGEGSQMEGWGLYFSSSPSVAKWYAEEVTSLHAEFDGVPFMVEGGTFESYLGKDSLTPEETFAVFLMQENMDYGDALASVDDRFSLDETTIERSLSFTPDHLKSRMNAFLRREYDADSVYNALRELGEKIKYQSGFVYRVEIPETNELLDLNTPLAEQPTEVQQAVWQVFRDGGLDDAKLNLANGHEIQDRMGDSGMDPKDVSMTLLDAGVQGFTYIGHESGQRNFVVFDENKIELVETRSVDENSPTAADLAEDLGLIAELKRAEQLRTEEEKWPVAVHSTTGDWFSQGNGKFIKHGTTDWLTWEELASTGFSERVYENGKWVLVANSTNPMAKQLETRTLNQGPTGDLVMQSRRGERVTGTARFSAEEKTALKEAAELAGVTIKSLRGQVGKIKAAHPASDGWAPLVFTGIETKKGEVVLDGNGRPTPKFKPVPYSFNKDAKGRQLDPKKTAAAYNKRKTALAKGLADEVRQVYDRMLAGDQNAANIMAQAGWYREMRTRLRKEFGGMGDLFADLLGATSPNTPVRMNWDNAIEALRRAQRGDYDLIMPEWEAWADNVDQAEAELGTIFNALVADGMTKKKAKAQQPYVDKLKEVKGLRELSGNLLPLKEDSEGDDGAKFGFNGRNVARVMVDLWRTIKEADTDISRGGQAPKAQNFSGNLIGFRSRATIDVWAARLLQRKAGQRRIPSRAEGSVSGFALSSGETTHAFGLGQDVFTDAVAMIRSDPEMSNDKRLASVNDDDLQAIVWFIEKEVWTNGGWTTADGEGGSFEFEANLAGSAKRDAIKEQRKVSGSKNSTPEEKAAARQALRELERNVDRFVGGLSPQQNMATQGIDFVPGDHDMARLGEAIRLAIYENDADSIVLGSKALATEGRYGDIERSLDLEVVAREGYDPTALWLKMVEEAKAANQDSTFLSRVVRTDEEIDFLRHRPGVEIYFKESKTGQELEDMLAELSKEGASFLTVVVDGRRSSEALSGAMPGAVGARIQWVPEFMQRYREDGDPDLSAMSDDELAAETFKQYAAMQKMAAKISDTIDGVSFAGTMWHETRVAFSHEYDGELNANSTGTAEDGAAGSGKRVWTGQPSREGLEGADRQRGAPSPGQGQPQPGDPESGDAQPVTLNQGTGDGPRGQIQISSTANVIRLFESADLSTFLHESGHFFLEVMGKVAAQESAPQQVKDDMAALLKWMKVDSFDQIEVRHHEQFARGFEAYLREGKAPSQELKDAFSRFRAWLVNVYRNVAKLDVQLTDEVRGVMDRLLATEEEIASAEQQYRGTALFKEAAKAGMTKAEFGAYQKLVLRASREAEEWLTSKIMKEVGRERKAEWQASLKEITAEVEARLRTQREYQALHFLTTGKPLDGTFPEGTPAFRLNKQDVIDQYGKQTLARLQAIPGRRNVYGSEDTALAPDLLAPLLGFDSGAELVRALMDTPKLKDAVAAEVDQRMKALHGDMLTDGSLREAAAQAMHEPESRAQVLAQELRILRRLGAGELVQAGADRQAQTEGAQTSAPDDAAAVDAAVEAAEAAVVERGARDYQAAGTVLAAQREQADAAANVGQRRAQTAAAGQARDATTGVNLKAMRQQAEDIISRRPVRDAGRVSAHAAAEIRAARRTEDAVARRKYDEAALYKRQQLLNHYLVSEAMKAKAEIDRATKYLRTFRKKSVRDRLPADYVEQIDGMLGQFDLRNVSKKAAARRQSLAAWVEERKADGLPIDIPDDVMADAGKRPLQDISLEEMRGLVDAVKSVAHLARLKERLLKQAKWRKLQKAAEALADSLMKHANRTAVTRVQSDLPWNKRRQGLADYLAKSRRIPTFVREMDGGKSGGVMWQLVIEPLNKAAARLTGMTQQHSIRMAEIYKEHYTAAEQRKMLRKPVQIPELGIGLTKDGLLALAMNWGNELNRDRLMRGEGWTQSQVEAALATLTSNDWSFVQAIWAHLDTYQKDFFDNHQAMFGQRPVAVEASPFSVTTADGQKLDIKGGYYPIAFDPKRSTKQGERKLMAEGQRFSNPVARIRAGSSIQRVEGKVEIPLRLSVMSVVNTHVADTLHHIAFDQPLLDVARVMNHDLVKDAVVDNYGPQVMERFNRLLNDLKFGVEPAKEPFQRFVDHARNGTSVAGMAFSVTTAALQPLGLANSIVALRGKGESARTGWYWMAKGIARMGGTTAKDKQNAAAYVTTNSEFMRYRRVNPNREIGDVMNTIRARGWRTKLDAAGFWAIANVQFYGVDMPTWYGALEKAKAAGEDHVTSVAIADQTVRDAQGGGELIDQVEYQRDGPYARLFTNFMSYMATTYSLQAEKTRTTNFKSLDETLAYAHDTMMLLVVPAVGSMLLDLLAEAARGDEDDEDEDIAARISSELALMALGPFIGFREFGGLTTGYTGYDGPAGLSVFGDTYGFATQAAQLEADESFYRSTIRLGGVLFHLPAVQIDRTTRGAHALATGQTDHIGALLFGPPRDK